MDIFLFIIMALAIVLLIAATSRAANNTFRINASSDGIKDGELQRLLRESQLLQQQGGTKAWSANGKHSEITRAVSETAPILTGKADSSFSG